MKTTNIEIASVYARNGRIDVEELTIKAELTRSHDICYLISGRNQTSKALLYQSRNINDALAKMNDLMLELLNKQAFALNNMAKEME